MGQMGTQKQCICFEGRVWEETVYLMLDMVSFKDVSKSKWKMTKI